MHALRYTAAMHTYEYPRPALTADVAVFRRHGETYEVLLVYRGIEPHKDRWALPGGFVNEWELPEDAARRELAEETGVVLDGDVVLAGVFGRPGRDPRGWTVTAGYAVLLETLAPALCAGDDAAQASWAPLRDLPPLAFDHDEIVQAAVEALGLVPA